MRLDTPKAEEYAFIFDSWARAFMKSPYAGCIRNCDYDTVSRATASEIIDRPARVTVAVEELADGTRRIMGYSVSEPERKVLHWVYVKRDARGIGIGRMLRREACPDSEIGQWTYTYRTHASERFLRSKGDHMKWSPVAARTK